MQKTVFFLREEKILFLGEKIIVYPLDPQPILCLRCGRLFGCQAVLCVSSFPGSGISKTPSAEKVPARSACMSFGQMKHLEFSRSQRTRTPRIRSLSFWWRMPFCCRSEIDQTFFAYRTFCHGGRKQTPQKVGQKIACMWTSASGR